MTLTAAQTDRAIGTFVASAAGDALGAGYEFGSAPYDGHPRMIGGGLGGFAPGEWTDDTAQATAIARVAATGVDLRSTEALDSIAAGFAEWYAGGPSDVGIQTAAVLRAAGHHPTAATMTAAARAEHDRSGQSAGNGSLMRTAPVALAYLGPGEESALVEAAHAVSALTHPDPLAGDGAALWCLMIREAVLTGGLPTPGELVRHLRDPDRWRAVVDEAESNSPGAFTENGWVVGAFQAAWSAITHTPTPIDLPGRHLRGALATAIGIGHDTDTVAAIAGALLGARWGVTSVPLAWQRILHGWPGLRTVDLTSLAIRIAVGDNPGTWPQTDRVDYSWQDATPSYVEHPLVPNLVIGSATALDDLPEGVDAVVSLCRVGTAQVPAGLESVEVRLIDTDAADNPNLDLLVDDAARTTVAMLTEGKRVYLHCVAAQSRTPTVATRVAALLGHDTDEALRAVVDSLPVARPQRFLVDSLRRLSHGPTSSLGAEVDYGFNSDEDGDWWLHSEAPESDDWIVTRRRAGGTGWMVVERGRAGFPGIGWKVPRNAWFVDRGYDVRVVRPDGSIVERLTNR